jgi:hypothetical protein
MLEGEPYEWGPVASCVADPSQEEIEEAIRWIGPLSPQDLGEALAKPENCIARIHYHVTKLVDCGVMVRVGQRPAEGSLESLYHLRNH